MITQLTLSDTAPNTPSGAPAGAGTAWETLEVSYTHPTLGPVYVAPVPTVDAKGRWQSVMGDPPVSWIVPLGGRGRYRVRRPTSDRAAGRPYCAAYTPPRKVG